MPAIAVPPMTALATQVSTPLPARFEAARRGRIHSIFRTAFNVALPSGDLVVIADRAAGGLPNGVLVDLGPDHRHLGLAPDQPVLLDARSIVAPAIGLRIGLQSAARWSPRLCGADPDAGRRWRERASDVHALAAARAIGMPSAGSGGFGGLLAADRFGRLPLHAARAASVLDQLAAALPGDDVQTAGQIARRLVGLGPGLTPSGDDALIGLAAALHGTGHPARRFLGEAVEDAPTRTTAVAATLLRHAADGEFSERLQRLLAALLGDDDAAVPPAIDATIAWGATSGTDCLVGVLFGLDVAMGTIPHAASVAG